MKKLLQKIIIIAIAISPLSTLAVGTVYTSGASFRNGNTNIITMYGSASGNAGTFSGAQNLLVNFGYAKVEPLFFGALPPVPKSCKDITGLSYIQVTPQQKITAGHTSVSFSATSSILQPNSTYWYCAIAKDDGFPSGVSLGEVKSFTTKKGLINTNGVTEITENSAVLNTFITTPVTREWQINFRYQDRPWKNGGCENTGILGNFLPYTGSFTDYFTVNKDYKGTGDFQQKLIDLNPGTTYYACAVISTIKNGVPYAYGEVVSFNTLGLFQNETGTKIDPTSASSGPKRDDIGVVTTYETKNVGDTGAILQGNVSRVKDTLTAYAYFRVSTFAIPPLFCNDIYGSEKGDIEAQNDLFNPVTGGKIKQGDFKSVINGLIPDTEYYYCAFVSNSANHNPTEIEYGRIKKFRTLPCSTCDKISVETEIVKNILSTSVSLQGNYNSDVELDTHFEYKENPDGGFVGTQLDGSSTVIGTEWKSVGTKARHPANSYGDVNFTLTGLKQNAPYLVRIVGETTGIPKRTIYGNPVNFKTVLGTDLLNKNGPIEFPELPGVLVNPGLNIPTTPSLPSLPGTPYEPGLPDFPNVPGTPYEPGLDNGDNPVNPNEPGNPNYPPLDVGTVATPPIDATVHYHEGVETVFQRQIVANTAIATYYGYDGTGNLANFGWTLAHELALEFGYVNGKGREIRVSQPDVSAYELRLNGNGLTVYEYYKGVVIDIRATSFSFKVKNQYEYYFKKVLKIFQ